VEARHLSAVPDPPPPTGALLDLFGAEPEARARYERACRRYVLLPDGEVLAFRSALARRGCPLSYEGVEAALYALALEEMPVSWAAGRERLRNLREDRNADDRTPGRALEDLMANETVWLREMALLAEDPPSYESLREVSAGAWSELRRRGKEYPPERFSDHVRAVGHSVFPFSPAFAPERDAASG